MTDEEAVEVLQDLLDTADDLLFLFTTRQLTALEIAIEVLQGLIEHE